MMRTSTTTWTCRRSSVEVTGPEGVHHLPLTAYVDAWFTGAVLRDGRDGNLAHHVPHSPDRLAAARAEVAAATATDVRDWQLMRQAHGADVAVIDADVAPGTEIRDVDVMVTREVDRPLVVLAADCLPIVAAGRSTIGVAHAGWRGLAAGVPDVLVSAFERLGERPADVRVAIGPAIGPCCYAVGDDVLDVFAASDPAAITRTRSGATSIDLRAIARDRLAVRGVGTVDDVGRGGSQRAECTSCGDGWFSHRRDARSGRHAGLVVRRPSTSAEGQER